jgi:hypothetical protein
MRHRTQPGARLIPRPRRAPRKPPAGDGKKISKTDFGFKTPTRIFLRQEREGRCCVAKFRALRRAAPDVPRSSPFSNGKRGRAPALVLRSPCQPPHRELDRITRQFAPACESADLLLIRPSYSRDQSAPVFRRAIEPVHKNSTGSRSDLASTAGRRAHSSISAAVSALLARSSKTFLRSQFGNVDASARNSAAKEFSLFWRETVCLNRFRRLITSCSIV